MILAALALLLVGLALFLTQPMAPRPVAPAAVADVKRLRRDVRELCRIRPRNLTDPERYAEAVAYLRSRWVEAGLNVQDQPYEVSGVPVTNLIVRFGPEGGERVVVGAHYDVAGPYPGADDNASGAAGLLELGRMLREHPPAGSVELVLYTLEEPPWFGGPQMGSAVHAKSLRAESVRVRTMIALEMIGCFSDAPKSQSYPSPLLKILYPTRGNFVAVAGRVQDLGMVRRVKRAMAAATALPVRSINAPPALAQHDLSDHRSYWNERYSAVMVTDTAFFRNTRYHTAEDTPELLDYFRMANVVTGVFAAVQSLAAP